MRVVALSLLLALGWLAPAPAQAQYGGALVRCKSAEFRDNYCPANTRGGVVLVRQISRNPCYEGETWGYDRRGIWVTGGCDAEFQVRGGYGPPAGQRYGYEDPRYGAPPPGAYPPPAPVHPGGGAYGRGPGGGRIVCESRDYRYHYCPVPVGRDVDLVAQYSKSPCRYQATWGYDRGGIWVDRGCAAEFVVY